MNGLSSLAVFKGIQISKLGQCKTCLLFKIISFGITDYEPFIFGGGRIVTSKMNSMLSQERKEKKNHFILSTQQDDLASWKTFLFSTVWILLIRTKKKKICVFEISFWKNCFTISGTWEHLDTLGIVSLKFMLVQPSAFPLALAWHRTPLRWDSWNFLSPVEAAVRNRLPTRGRCKSNVQTVLGTDPTLCNWFSWMWERDQAAVQSQAWHFQEWLSDVTAPPCVDRDSCLNL